MNFTSQLNEITGGNMDVEVDWDSLASHSVHTISNQLDRRGFQYVLDAIKNICVDDMGKEAIREGVKKIVIIAKDPNTDSREAYVKFVDGVLTFHNGIDGNGVYKDDKIQEVLEAAL
ncbi:MAG: hypothetical protein OEZ39_13450 [Gammaproteobacteria bacterium]|nr:hypothetical protein [Gammaproteobacteria bacterium]MDH5652856.1 hypothetical protein [Gammaproteobacteria bacterium]